MAEAVVETPAQREKLEAEAAKFREEAAFLTAQKVKALAESSKFQAEASKFQAEAEQATLEARARAADVRVAEINLERVIELRDAEKASDTYNKVYRFHDQVGTKSVEECIEQTNVWRRTAPGCPMEIIFFTPGGSVLAGLMLYDQLRLLRREGHMVTVGTQGWAASMGALLLQGGEHRYTSSEATIIVHQPSTIAMGKLQDIKEEAKWLDKVWMRQCNILAQRSAEAKRKGTAKHPLSQKQFMARSKNQDWFITSDEALDWGLVDEIR